MRRETPTVPAAAVRGLLTVDCGNTTIDVLRHDSGERRRFATADIAAASAWLAALAPSRVVAVTVVPDVLGVLAARGGCSTLRIEVAGRDLPCPLRLDYETPATLGADRWVGALAAHSAHGAAVVVDCGSATTINLVDREGTFRGGVIAPGVRALIAGMQTATPRLPVPDLAAQPVVPARSSQAAVDAGVLLGYAGLVERLVAEALRGTDSPTAVVLTGGNAPLVQRWSGIRAEHVPDLVHQGLRLLAERRPCAS